MIVIDLTAQYQLGMSVSTLLRLRLRTLGVGESPAAVGESPAAGAIAMTYRVFVNQENSALPNLALTLTLTLDLTLTLI